MKVYKYRIRHNGEVIDIITVSSENSKKALEKAFSRQVQFGKGLGIVSKKDLSVELIPELENNIIIAKIS